jgi:acyl-CoA reductase-like NAD-dependent aldehyde dehydrogenase
VEERLAAGVQAQADWRRVPLADRIVAVTAMVDAFVAMGPEAAQELSWQIGRPIAHSPHEIAGFASRARSMLALAPEALAPVVPTEKEGFRRFVERTPVGLVLVLAPWNFPYLTAVNTVVPALVAGNAVLLKHSNQTPLCAERLSRAAEQSGLPKGVFQHLHMSHEAVARVVADPRVSHVAFTGSVEGGRAVHGAMAGGFGTIGLELGGKDPAYVREDADAEQAARSLVDGAFYNAGQSCCGVERIYVHQAVYDQFLDAFVAEVQRYRMGSPLDPETTLGPMVREDNADRVRAQIASAEARGAQGLINAALFSEARKTGAYLAPQVLVGVDHSMEVMKEETFGPVVGIMKVYDDAEAVKWMNDSRYGLTASIWTADLDVAQALGAQVETGTVFANRCDYLDPELAWVGVKDSGRGCTLSRVGYEALTRPKSFHLKEA